MARMTQEERDALEAIPEDEYARQEIKYHEEQAEYWRRHLNEL